MNTGKWFKVALLVGAVYFVVGFSFAKFNTWAATDQTRIAWNRLAFLISALVFVVHIGYEHFQLRHPAKVTAWHASLAAAIGGFLLAVSANIHELGSASGFRPRLLTALVLWPLITGVPAFIVALVVTMILSLKRRPGTVQE